MERSHFVILAVCGALFAAATPAERRIEIARATLEQGGPMALGARELAIGFVRRAREGVRPGEPAAIEVGERRAHAEVLHDQHAVRRRAGDLMIDVMCKTRGGAAG